MLLKEPPSAPYWSLKHEPHDIDFHLDKFRNNCKYECWNHTSMFLGGLCAHIQEDLREQFPRWPDEKDFKTIREYHEAWQSFVCKHADKIEWLAREQKRRYYMNEHQGR